MNAVKIEETVSQLSVAPFEPENFPYAFLEAFGNKPTEIQRLKNGNSNKTDIEGAILQRSNIHLIVSSAGDVTKALSILRDSPVNDKRFQSTICVDRGGQRFDYRLSVRVGAAPKPCHGRGSYGLKFCVRDR